jgi:two-component system sensor histidine kinase ChvG
MSLNLIAILILVIGVAYLDQYRDSLTTAEMETLSVEAQLYAAVISESSFDGTQFNRESAAKILSSLGSRKRQRIHIFSPEGRILMDSKNLTLKNSAAPSPYSDALPGVVGRFIESSFAKFVDTFSVRFNLPPYPDSQSSNSTSFPDVNEALQGAVSLSAWQGPNKGLILSAAAPITSGKTMAGAVLVTRTDTSIEYTFANMRLDILKLFLIALTVTLSLSLYLSAAIGHPLRRLAYAAERVRKGHGKYADIPDMRNRHDEIGELSIALRQMTKALHDRLATIEEFAADVSHELKNPLTSMRSAIETLQKIKSDNDRERLSEIILHDLQRMDRLITDISQASRMDTELSRDILSPIDLRDVLLPLIDAYRKPIEREGVAHESTSTIQFSGLESPVMVMGHPRRLAQVFQNLISNALSFSPENRPIKIRVEPTGDTVKISVEDEGPGIPDSKLEKVFERFYSERPSTEEFGSHSGLGLSISRQIVEAHGGVIRAENRIDSEGRKLGARFVTWLNVPGV